MSINATPNKTQRISITVPIGMLEKVKYLADDTNVSGFFSEAAAEKIAREERRRAFHALLEEPPTHTSIDNTSTYLKELREEGTHRDVRLGL